MTDPAALPDERNFKKGIKLIDLVMLGAGTAIGSSVFTVMSPAAKVGGSGMVIALIIAAAPMLIFGLVYAYMASAVPKTAATFEWQRDYTSPVIAFGIVWSIACTDDAIFVTRRGRVCRRLDVIAHARAQSVRLTAGPLQQLLSLGTVHIDAPPGPVQVAARNRELGEARAIVESAAARAHHARAIDPRTDRWAT